MFSVCIFEIKFLSVFLSVSGWQHVSCMQGFLFSPTGLWVSKVPFEWIFFNQNYAVNIQVKDIQVHSELDVGVLGINIEIEILIMKPNSSQ